MNIRGPTENWEIEDVHIHQPFGNLEVQNFKCFDRNNEFEQKHSEVRESTEKRILLSRSETKSAKLNTNSPKTTSRRINRDSREKRNEDSALILSKFATQDKKNDSKFLKVMLKFYLVKKFLRFLRENTIYRTPKQLKASHYNMINDWAYSKPSTWETDHSYLRILSEARFFRKCTQIFSHMLGLKMQESFKLIFNKISRVIHPTRTFRLIWDLVQIILTVAYSIIVPIRIGFDIDLMDGTIPNVFQFIATFFFIMDIAINFNTAIYSKGELIKSRMLIFKNYIASKFFFDVLSISSLLVSDIFNNLEDQTQPQNVLIKVLAFLFAFRIHNLSKAISRFEEFIFTDENTYNIISFARLIFGILLFSHWSACLWALIGKSDSENGWLASYNVDKQSIVNQYVYSLYYVVVVINTVGFGDIVSNTIREKIFSICFINIACVLFAFTLNRIGMILQNINKSERDLKRNLNLINGFMKYNNIDFELKIKIRNYLEYIWNAEKQQNRHETQDVINRLSQSLREELLLKANGVLIKDIALLTNNFSGTSLRNLVHEMKEINLTPGDIIFREKDISKRSLYIIKDGEVTFYMEPSNRENTPTNIKTLKKGDYFGEYSFFSGNCHLYSAKSLSFSSLFVINQDAFIEILKNSPEDFEKYCQIRDQINLYKDLSQIYFLCEVCRNPNHTIIHCPLLHLSLSKSRIIDKYNFSIPQLRKYFVREKAKKCFQTLKQRKLIDLSARNLTYDLFEADLYASVENESMKEDPNVQSSKEYLQSHNHIQSSNSIHHFISQEYIKKTSSGSIKDQTKKSLEKKTRFQNGEEEDNDMYDSKNELEHLMHFLRFSYDLDTVHSYETYFRHQNVEQFIEKINAFKPKKQKKSKVEMNISAFFSTFQKKTTKINFNYEEKIKKDFNKEMEKFFKDVKHQKKETEQDKLWKIYRRKKNSIKKKRNLVCNIWDQVKTRFLVVWRKIFYS